MTALEVRLLGRVRIADDAAKGAQPDAWLGVLTREATALGFTLTPDLRDAFGALDETAFRAERARLLAALGEVSGASVEHTHLFSGFPYDVPDQFAYLWDRFIGYIKHRAGVRGAKTFVLSCGHAVDGEQFDLDAFGACPICQFSVAEMRSPSGRRYDYRDLTPLKTLGLLTQADAVAAADAFLARPSSLSADEKAFLYAQIAAGAALTVPAALFRETLPFAYLLGGVQAVAGHISGATDVLRIAALLSDATADLSLKTPVKFRLSTAHGGRLLGLLEGRPDIAEDLLRHREPWLRFGEHLHVGSARNRRRFPKVAAAFDALRNRPETIVTFNRQVERGVRSKTVSPELLALLRRRPGELARRLDLLLRIAGRPDAVIAAARQAVPRLTTKLLFELQAYFRARSVARPRVFLPKGNENRVQVAPDRRAAIPAPVLAAIGAVIDAELLGRLRTLPPLGAVYVDPALKDHLLPFNRRGDAAALGQVTKGSRYPFAGEVVRLFVHWIGRVDVDLSVILYDEALTSLGHVAFSNLQHPGVVHSGDIQDAPDGASEFIDFDVASVTAQGVRYVAAWVHSFRGQPFAGFPCFAGFMQRDGLRSGAVYEPEAVALKFDIHAANTSHLPLIFDLKTRQVIFADMAAGKQALGGVHTQQLKHRTLVESVLDMRERKPTWYDVVSAHVAARGRAVGPDAAELRLGVEDLDAIRRDFGDLEGGGA